MVSRRWVDTPTVKLHNSIGELLAPAFYEPARHHRLTFAPMFQLKGEPLNHMGDAFKN
jgi:hypothetical protein